MDQRAPNLHLPPAPQASLTAGGSEVNPLGPATPLGSVPTQGQPPNLQSCPHNREHSRHGTTQTQTLQPGDMAG